MIEETKEKLLSFMEQSGKSQNQIANESGLSATAISQFLSGTYSGDNEKVASTIHKYLIIAEERLNDVNSETFYKELSNTQTVLFGANYAHRKCDIVLVSGDSGAGKTTALKYYVQQNAGVIFVTANSSTKSATAILRKIADSIGRQSGGNKQFLMDTLVSYLNNTKRLIIIDEADHLTLNALQAVRNLNDEAHVGIVLSGNNKLYNQMLMGSRGYEFDQIRTRIFIKPKVYNEYTLEEIKNIFPDCDENVLLILNKKANEGSLREARKLYEFGMEYSKSNNVKLTGKVLKFLMSNI